MAPEAGCGKLCVVQGADLEGRPVVLMRPRCGNAWSALMSRQGAAVFECC